MKSNTNSKLSAKGVSVKRRSSSKKNEVKKVKKTNPLLLCLPKDYKWKVLQSFADDVFSTGSLSQEDYDIITYIVRNRDVESYDFLSEAWGLQDINSTYPGCSSSLHLLRTRYQLASLLKKFSLPDDEEAARTKAIVNFYLAEADCHSFNHGGYRKLLEEGKPVLYYARRFIQRVIGEMPIGSGIIKWAKHGPGANLDTDKTGIVDSLKKFESWPYSVTERCHPYARFLIETDARWMGALIDDYHRREGIPVHYPLDMKVFWAKVLKIVDKNEIRFVPKTRVVMRSIAIEPTMNLMLQLGTDGFIRKRLKRFGIDLDDQSINQKLARQGSLDATDESLVTIDLSRASDTISLKICELLLPPLWFEWLLDLRAPYGACEADKSVFKYEKISSMGNGSTFVIESLLFAAIIYAVGEVEGRTVRFGNNAAVYGDDLIIEKCLGQTLVKALNLCGFSVNTEKSFLNGVVRESCGTDWVRGVDLRPIFLRQQPKFVPELFNDYNRLQRVLELNYGLDCTSSATLKMVAKWIPQSCSDLIGPYNDEDTYGYRHVKFAMRNKRGYKNGLFKFSRLVKRLKVRTSDAFHFRKLMASLSPHENPDFVVGPFDKGMTIEKGNRFDIGERKFPVFCRQNSRTSYWCENYGEVVYRKT